MARSESGRGDDALLKKLHRLEQDWKSYQLSAPTHRRSRSIADPTPDFLHHLLRSSPKKLISSLQRSESPSPPGGMNPRSCGGGGKAADEIVAQRRGGIRRGRFRGTRLLEALEGARGDVAGSHGKEEICSVCSSALVQGGGEFVSSSCSCCSSSIGRDGYDAGFSSSSSSVLSFEEERVGVWGGGGGGGGRWMVRLAWFAVVLAVLALGLVSLREFGTEEYGEFVVPT